MPIQSIPASEVVSVTPNVIAGGGTGLTLSAIFLTESTRPPIGNVVPFPNAPAVSAYFGPESSQYAAALVYFAGFSTSSQKPGTLGYWQFPMTAVSAYLRGADVAEALTLPQLKALSGALTVAVDGATWTDGSISLSAATSFSSAASIITTGITGSPPSGASVTASIAPSTGSVTASIEGNVMTVTAVTSGVLVPGGVLSGTGVTSGTVINNQLNGTAGGIGTYAVSPSQVVASTAVAETYGTMTVSGVSSGVVAVGQTASGSGVTTGTLIMALGTGTGADGTYIVNPTQTAMSTTVALTPTAPVVTFDSISGAFIITSGTTGAVSTLDFATGSLAVDLLMTSSTGAVLSQGAAAVTPAATMNALTNITTDFGSFMTDFDPDGGGGNTQKYAFANWNGEQDDSYVYVCWDTDASPTVTVPATTSLGYLLAQSEISGTALIWEPTGGESVYEYAAFLCGAIASVNFSQENGRINFKFKGQSGLTPTVTTASVAANLDKNGYNFYASYATAGQQFIFFGNGKISGPFNWIDSYINEIWIDSMCQLALMLLLTTINSIPFTPAGAAILEGSLTGTPATGTSPPTGPITSALFFGAIDPGVPLSSDQVVEVNTAAGLPISGILQAIGYYLQVNVASPSTRASRGPWNINLWYTDGGSVNLLNVDSTALQ